MSGRSRNCLIGACCIALSLAHTSKAQDVAEKDFSTQQEKIVQQLATARQAGVGTKPYEVALSSIEHDFRAGAPKDQIMKRLDSLGHNITSQLSEMAALKMGALSGVASAGEAREWGEYTPYMVAVQSKIRRQWHPPTEAKSRRMTITFKVNRNGGVLALKITQSSGIDELDQSILKAVEEASPFAKLPTFCKQNDLDIQFTFDYNARTGLQGAPASAKVALKQPTQQRSSADFDIDTFVYTIRGTLASGDVTPDFLQEVKRQVSTIPTKLLAGLQSRGGRICVTPRITDKMPGYQNTRPRGWEDGYTGKNVDGLFDGKDVIICEYRSRVDDELSLIKCDRVGYLVHHELGHAFDRYWSRLSESEEFKHTYMLDLAHMDAEEREGELAYFAQKANAGASECFAELFGVMTSGGGSNSSKKDAALIQCFPNYSKLIRQRLQF
jgi:TonB family protein